MSRSIKQVLGVLLIVLFVPVMSHSQSSITVADGTSTNDQVPVYGYFVDSYVHCQTIYPSAMLQGMVGKSLTEMVYYLSTVAQSDWGNALFSVKLMEVQQQSFASLDGYIDVSGATTVFEGPLWADYNVMEIFFSQAYIYNGGNLLIDISSMDTGTYSDCLFYGIASPNASAHGFSYGSVSAATYATSNFIPKTTFVWGNCVVPGYYDTVDHYIPVYGLYADAFMRNQTIYPSSMLPINEGDTIKALSYPLFSPSASEWSRASFQVKIREALMEAYSGNSYLSMTGATTVYQGALDATGDVMTVLFAEPYVYQGGNLVVEYSTVDTGNWSGCSYYGLKRTGASLRGHNYSSVSSITPTVSDFMPMTFFTLGQFQAETIYECDTIETFPYIQNFDGDDVSCWFVNDYDGDGNFWDWLHIGARSGSSCVGSYSYDNEDGVLTPDNFLITPPIVVNEENLSLSYYVKALDTNWVAEHLAVYVSTTGDSPSDFLATIPLEEYTMNNSYKAWVRHTVSLSQYYGQTISIAFRHYNSSDQFAVIIDDMSIEVDTATPYYTISAFAENPMMGTVVGGGVYPAGATVTLTAVPNSGYHFVQWNDGLSIPSRQISVTSNASYSASFDVDMVFYEITAEPNDPLMGTVTGGGVYQAGTTVTLTAMPNSGYHFVQWSDGMNAPSRQITVTSNASYYAFFSEDVVFYEITAEPNDPVMGMVTGGGSYVGGTVATLVATAFNGYHFVQWSDGLTTSTRSFPVTGNASYTAFFAANVTNYTLTVTSNNADWGSVTGGGTYPEGSSVTITANASNGYHFVQWDDGNTNSSRQVIVTSDMSYMAEFAADIVYYSIMVRSADDNQGAVMGSGVYASGEVIFISAIPNQGYRFLNWQDGNTDNPRMITVAQDETYTAYFQPIPHVTYTITATTNDPTMGVVTGGGTYEEGSVVTLRAVAFEGYDFVQWNDGNVDNPRLITVDGNASYVAMFQPIQLITTDQVPAFSLSPNPVADELILHIDGFVGECELEIVDAYGRAVYTKRFCAGGDVHVIDVSWMTTGMYLVRVKNESGSFCKRVVVQR